MVLMKKKATFCSRKKVSFLKNTIRYYLLKFLSKNDENLSIIVVFLEK